MRRKPKPLPVRSIRLSGIEWRRLNALAKKADISRGRWIVRAMNLDALGGAAEILTDNVEAWIEERLGVVVQDEPGNARAELLALIRGMASRARFY